jgi:hypothetical protein
VPEYLYGCDKDKTHPRVTIVHGMLDNPMLECEVCHARMHRIPQRFLWGVDPLSVLLEWGGRNWSHKKRGEPRENMYNDIKTNRGKPQKDYGYRR